MSGQKTGGGRFAVFFFVILILSSLCAAGCHLGEWKGFSRRHKMVEDPFNVPETKNSETQNSDAQNNETQNFEIQNSQIQNSQTQNESLPKSDGKNQNSSSNAWLHSTHAPSVMDWLTGSGSHDSKLNADASDVAQNEFQSTKNENQSAQNEIQTAQNKNQFTQTENQIAQNQTQSDDSLNSQSAVFSEPNPNDIQQASYVSASQSQNLPPDKKDFLSNNNIEESPHANSLQNAAFSQNQTSQNQLPQNSNAANTPQNNIAPLLQDYWIFNLELERYRNGEIAHADSRWRWRHRGIEEILILPQEYQPNYQHLLNHENAIARANAAIVLARNGNEQTASALTNIIHDVSLSLPMRCAAAETLGSLKSTSAETLIQLSDIYAEFTDAKGYRKPGVPALSIELLYAIAAKKPLSQEPCFVRPLESRDAKVRLAAIELWQKHAPQNHADENMPLNSSVTLPDCIAKYCGDSNTTIQEAAMLTVAAWRTPEALSSLDVGLRSPKVSVRLAAIRGLAILQTPEAIAILLPLMKDQSSAIRAETVRALNKAGLHHQTIPLSEDPSWEVRKAVAESLAEIENQQTKLIVQKYLNDVSPAVQIATLESLRKWKPETTASLLFEAMNSNILNTRMLAAELLSQYWKPAANYFPNDRTETRIAKYKELAAQFQRDVQSGVLRAEMLHEKNLLPTQPNSREENQWQDATQPMIADAADYRRVCDLLAQFRQPDTQNRRHEILQQLIAMETKLVPMLEQAVLAEGYESPEEIFLEVLPAVDSTFAVTARFHNENTTIRRSATSELVLQTRFGNVSPLLYRQLTDFVVRESDEIVLLRLWDFADRQAEKLAKSDAEWENAKRVSTTARSQEQTSREQFSREQISFRPMEKVLATISFTHTSPELHRRACLHIKDYGQQDDVAALLTEIHNPTTAVTRAALQALAKIGDANCAANVKPLLTHQQPLVVMDAAFALDQWNEPAGLDTLERLAASGDKTTKLAIAQGIRKTQRKKFVPILIRLLDESGTIRQESLDALPLIVGRDIVPPQELAYYTVQERVELWKKWNGEGGMFEGQ